MAFRSYVRSKSDLPKNWLGLQKGLPQDLEKLESLYLSCSVAATGGCSVLRLSGIRQSSIVLIFFMDELLSAECLEIYFC